MKINRKMIRKLCIIFFKTLLILGVLVVLGGFLWINQKPNFSKYHSYAIAGYGGNDNVPLTDEQFQRMIEAYENGGIHYWPTDRVCDGYNIYLYKTKDMSGKYDVLCTGTIQDNFFMIYTEKNCKTFSYDEPITARHVETVIKEAINEAKGE